MLRYLLVFIFLKFSFTISAKNYFIASNGNDNNSGTSQASPWKTISKINSIALSCGDSVFFKKDDIFEGEIIIKNSGCESSPIIIGAYGSGNNPVITGSTKIDKWEKGPDNILKSKTVKKVFQLFHNESSLPIARFPNNDYLLIDKGHDNLSFQDNDLNGTDYSGATIRFRIYDWEYRTSTVKSFTNKTITISEPATTSFSKGWGYYLENKAEYLDTINEWFYDINQSSLLLKTDQTNLTDNIYATVYSTGITIDSGVNYITIIDLDIEKFHDAGITLKGKNKNIIVKGNSIKHIRLTGIYLAEGSEKCTIDNNTFLDIHGRGIYACEATNLTINENTLRRIGMIPGYGINGVNGMIGISITNIEEPKKKGDRISTYNKITNNRIDSTGYVGIRMDGAYSSMTHNYLTNAMIHLSDGAAIYCWARSGNYTHDNKIAHNIVENVTGNNAGTPGEKSPIAFGIYLDNNVYNIECINNTIINISGGGIFINASASNNIIKDNIVFNSREGISIAEWGKDKKSTFGNIITNNIIYLSSPAQRCVYLINWIIPDTRYLGHFNHNIYIVSDEKYLFKDAYLSKDHERKIQNEFTFAEWKKKYRFDEKSRVILIDSPLRSNYPKAKIFYNSSTCNMTTPLPTNTYADVEGQSFDRLELLPFTGKILFHK